MGRILVVEDEPGARLLLQSRLEDLGHEVATAPTGAMGLMEARSGGFDLFLVDVVLGSGVDGLEVTRRLRALPQTHGVPVVLVSGQSTSREDLHRGYEAGCSAFLIKSDLSLLEDVVRAMLHIKSLQDDLSMQNRLLEQQNRTLQEEKQRGADLELALRESGSRSLVFREFAAGRPDGILLVDSEGRVRIADRGAREMFGEDLEGRSLGRLAPASGLEAFVRDARTEAREGFRLDLSERGARRARSITASVLPLNPEGTMSSESGFRAVLLLDAGKRQVAAEILRMQEQGVPRREMGPLLEAARERYHPSALVGSSPAMTALRTSSVRAARADGPVLVRGEVGADVELVARALHFGGERSGPFVPVNCGAIGAGVLRSELFGHVKGAFAGAFTDRPGLFHQAHLGTLFLDEIGDLPLELQDELLDLLQTGELRRVGGERSEHVDVRVIVASSRDLEREEKLGRLRPELRVRLSTELDVPPLRERPEDIALLIEETLCHFAADRPEVELLPEAVALLESYAWPGNERELRATIERACAVTADGTIGVEHLSRPIRDTASEPARDVQVPVASRRVGARPGVPALRHVRRRAPMPALVAHGAAEPAPAPEPLDDGVDAFLPGPASLDRYERAAILHALQETGGDRLAAARLLEVGKSTLYRKLKRHGIT